MKLRFALIDGERRAPEPGLQGVCPGCDQPVIAKCGEVRVWHWAHSPGHTCDPWKENESEWHRAWKDEFPEDWQEIQHSAADGEKHVADVKTHDGWVLEFQRSPISPQQRRARTEFYEKLAWVVDGTTRTRDLAQFLKAWKNGTPIGVGSPIRLVPLDGCARLEEWAGSQAHVFLEFGEDHDLWWLLPLAAPRDRAYVAQFPPRSMFIECHRQTEEQPMRGFDQLAGHILSYVAKCLTPPPRPVAKRPTPRAPLRLSRSEARALRQMRRDSRSRF